LITQLKTGVIWLDKIDASSDATDNDATHTSLETPKDVFMEVLEEESFDFEKTEMSTRLQTELDSQIKSKDQAQTEVQHSSWHASHDASCHGRVQPQEGKGWL
jgi:hypothetical protein